MSTFFVDEVLAELAGGQSNRRNPTCSEQRKGVAPAARASSAQVAEIGRGGAGQLERGNLDHHISMLHRNLT